MAEKEEQKKITTPKFRGSFVQVYSPKSYKGGALKYSIVMLYPKKLAATGELNNLQNLIKAAAIERWGEVPAGVVKIGEDTCPFKDGDLKDYDGYEGTYYATAASQYKPAIVDTGDARKEISPTAILDESEVYAGAYYRASVTAYSWEAMGKKGVSFGLQNIQKLADGEPFSGRGNPEDDFDPIIPEDVEVADTGNLFGEMTGESKKETVEEL